MNRDPRHAPSLLLSALLLSGCCAFSSPGWRGPQSAHFDGEKFHNQAPGDQPSVEDFLEWGMSRRPGPWRPYVDAPPGPPPVARVGRGELRVTWVGHATMLVQIDGLNVLTDPVWSHRIGPVSWAGPQRVRPPAIRFEDLPYIDVVLLSHNHYDHFDIPTIRRLAERDHPRIVTGLGNADILEDEEIDGGVELDWWESEEVSPGVRITVVPAQHFSMRGVCDRDATLWAGFVIEAEGGPVYFAGDTAWGPHFAQIRARFGPVRLAMLPIGAYLPRKIMAPMHVDPAEAVAAHKTLGAQASVAMHHGTFPQADEGQDAPVRDLKAALRRAGEPESRFRVLPFGIGSDVPPLTRSRPAKHPAVR